jgi:hypothetical protein
LYVTQHLPQFTLQSRNLHEEWKILLKHSLNIASPLEL